MTEMPFQFPGNLLGQDGMTEHPFHPYKPPKLKSQGWRVGPSTLSADAAEGLCEGLPLDLSIDLTFELDPAASEGVGSDLNLGTTQAIDIGLLSAAGGGAGLALDYVPQLTNTLNPAAGGLSNMLLPTLTITAAATPAFGAIGAVLTGSSSPTANVPLPGGIAENSLIEVTLYVESSQAVTIPAGFIEAPNSPVIVTGAGAHYLHKYYKRQGTATGSGETTGTYPFTIAAGLAWRAGYAVRYEGVITSGSPYDVTAKASSNVQAALPAVSFTTTVANTMLSYTAASYNGRTFTPPTGFNERADINAGIGLELADLVKVFASPTGNVQGVLSSNDYCSVWMGALLPAGTVVSDTPSISNISPNPGPAGTVTITGANFVTGGTTVSFGGIPATNVVVASSTQLSCTAPAHADGSVNVTATANSKTSAPFVFTYQAAPSGTLLFDAAYAVTNNWTRWNWVHTLQNCAPSAYVPDYYMSMYNDPNDPAHARASRHEVRVGDVPPNMPSGERSEVRATEANSGGTEGQIRFYRMSFRFDPTFPQDHASRGWGAISQWYSGGSPAIAIAVDGEDGNYALHNGKWGIKFTRQSAPYVYLGAVYPLNVPLGTGWHDLELEIKWSENPAVGYVRAWLGGVRQTFINGQTTYYERTLCPGGDGVCYWKTGYYRQINNIPTGIVFHTNNRCATTQSALG